MSKFYITTAIDYVNGKPHVGHAVEKLQADVLARYHRLIGDEVYFIGGTDENSLKSVKAAEKEGLTVQELVRRNSAYFEDLRDTLGISYDAFIKTSQEERHIKGAQKLWGLCDKAGAIYRKKYKGLYCVGCEDYKRDSDLVDGKCPDHNEAPKAVEEENYFFKLSDYQDKLKKVIESGKLKILPEHRKNEVLSFIDQGLEDFSISRSRERAKNWGVEVPNDPNEVMYVWFDALSSYINVLDYNDNGELYKKLWQSESTCLHCIGKGILRFHAIYWPAMLMAADLPLPSEIYVHEYLTINDKKISKTLGNVINPEEVVEKYGKDATRYLLLSALPYKSDGDISWEKMDEKYTADLVNGLGNVFSRVLTLCHKYLDGKVPFGGGRSLKLSKKPIIDNGSKVLFEVDEFKNIFYEQEEYLAKRDVCAFLDSIFGGKYLELGDAKEGKCAAGGDVIKVLDVVLEDIKPWQRLKENKDDEVSASLLYSVLETIRLLAIVLYPIMPDTSGKIMKTLGEEEALKGPTVADKNWGKLKSGIKLGNKIHLFPRL